MTRNALWAASLTLKRTGYAIWGARFISMAMPACLLLTAQAITPESNPYKGIVDRNVFSLKEIPPPPPPANPDANKPPPPPITLTGITTLFGVKRAYMTMNVPGGKPGEPAKATSMMLSEGQRDGEVEVMKIDPAAGSVLVKNRDTETNLTFDVNGVKPTAGGGTGTGAVAVNHPGGNPGGFSPGMGRSIPSRNLRVGGPITPVPAPNSGVNSAPFTPGSANSEGINGTFTPGTQIQKPAEPLTPAQQALLTEANYAAAVAKKDPTAGFFPPSVADPNRNATPTPQTAPNGVPAPNQQRFPFRP